MDHYGVLGVHRNASKEEIKQAFRKLAMELHPDRHAHSPNPVKDAATLKFKQLSEAYEVLTDDRKRADYNIGRRSSASSNYYNYSRGSAGGRGGRGYGYDYGYGYSGAKTAGAGGRTAGMGIKFEVFLRFLTTRTFLLNAAFAGVLLGGTFAVDAGRNKLWKMKNSGKSFEEAMDSMEQAKALKDKS